MNSTKTMIEIIDKYYPKHSKSRSWGIDCNRCGKDYIHKNMTGWEEYRVEEKIRIKVNQIFRQKVLRI